MNTLDKGKEGEDMTCAYLKKQGDCIRNRNFYYQKAEIDNIATKDDTIAIVEVKWRFSDFYGTPETFVTPKKRKLLARAADFYLQKFNWEGETRFDIISIVGQPPIHSLKHIEHTFYFV